MARPIEPTPRLRGKDAIRFIRASQNPQPFKEPELDIERMAREFKIWAEQQKKDSGEKHA